MVVAILARNVKGEDVSVEYTDKTLNVILKVPSQDDYNLKLNLAHKIVPDKCSYRVMSTKVEITLIKHDGLQWNTLEGDAPKGKLVHSLLNTLVSCFTYWLLVSLFSDATTCTGPPKYPTSHKVHKDWDAIEREIVKEFAAADKPQGQDGVNSLFQKIYGDGDDEVKRAMNKSFVSIYCCYWMYIFTYQLKHVYS